MKSYLLFLLGENKLQNDFQNPCWTGKNIFQGPDDSCFLSTPTRHCMAICVKSLLLISLDQSTKCILDLFACRYILYFYGF